MDKYATYDAMEREQQGRVHGSPSGSGRSGNILATLLAQAHRRAEAQATDPGPAGAGEGPRPSCSGQGQGHVHGSPSGSGRSGNILATLLAQAHRRAEAQATDPGPAGAGEGPPPSCSGQGARAHGDPPDAALRFPDRSDSPVAVTTSVVMPKVGSSRLVSVRLLSAAVLGVALGVSAPAWGQTISFYVHNTDPNFKNPHVDCQGDWI